MSLLRIVLFERPALVYVDKHETQQKGKGADLEGAIRWAAAKAKQETIP